MNANPRTTPAMTPGVSSPTLASRLGLTDQFIKPGYEDAFYYLWRERRLPVNVDPFDSRLDDEMERARLRRVFEQKLDAVVGDVLPLHARDEDRHPARPAVVRPWFLRDERMYLIPGDSPMGLRLPLDALPWASTADQDYLIEQRPDGAARNAARHRRIGKNATRRAAADERRTSLPYLAGVPGKARPRAAAGGRCTATSATSPRPRARPCRANRSPPWPRPPATSRPKA